MRSLSRAIAWVARPADQDRDVDLARRRLEGPGDRDRRTAARRSRTCRLALLEQGVQIEFSERRSKSPDSVARPPGSATAIGPTRTTPEFRPPAAGAVGQGERLAVEFEPERMRDVGFVDRRIRRLRLGDHPAERAGIQSAVSRRAPRASTLPLPDQAGDQRAGRLGACRESSTRSPSASKRRAIERNSFDIRPDLPIGRATDRPAARSRGRRPARPRCRRRDSSRSNFADPSI